MTAAFVASVSQEIQIHPAPHRQKAGTTSRSDSAPRQPVRSIAVLQQLFRHGS